jgi:hypothetical protein
MDDEDMDMDTDIETIVPWHDERPVRAQIFHEQDPIRNHCSFSLGMTYFRALENRDMIKVDDCKDMFLVRSVIDPLLEHVSYKLERSKDEFVAVHALTLGNDEPDLLFLDDTMLVIRENGCFVLHAQDDMEISLRYDKVIVAYTKVPCSAAVSQAPVKHWLRGEHRMVP